MQLAENTGRKKSPSGHHHTTLSGYIFATNGMYQQSEKNLLNSNNSSTPANFNGFSVLAALLHGL